MYEDTKPQSHKYQKEQQQSEKQERQKVEKVVTGKVKTKKKSEIHKFADIFISEDVGNMKSYIFLDVLVPAIKKAISDIVTDGIDMILYGGTGHSKKRRSSGSGASYVSYSSYSDRDRDRRDDRSRTRTRFDFDDIVLESKGEAEDVLDSLDALIDQYGMASVADLYDLVGVSGEYTDTRYGWTSLGANARAERLRNGDYILRLPKPMPIGR